VQELIDRDLFGSSSLQAKKIWATPDLSSVAVGQADHDVVVRHPVGSDVALLMVMGNA